MKFLKLKKKLEGTNDIKKIIKLLKKINLNNLDNEELESIINILDNKSFLVLEEHHALKNFLKNFALPFVKSAVVVFLGSKLLSFSINFIDKLLYILGLSIPQIVWHIFRKSKAEIACSNLPSIEKLTTFDNLKYSLKEHYQSRVLSLENKSVSESQSLALVSNPEKVVVPQKEEVKESNTINYLTDEFNRILDMENATDSRNAFINFTNNLLLNLPKGDSVTVNTAINLVGDYFLLMAKKPNMLVNALFYSLNSYYFGTIINALEKELNNVVDDVDTIIAVCRLTDKKNSCSDATYVNRLLQLYMNYNNKKGKNQVRAREQLQV